MRLSETFKRDDALLTWATVASSKLVEDASAFGLTPERAETYRRLVERYQAARAATTNPNLRRRLDTLVKDELKVELAAASRAVVKAFEAWEGCTDEKRSEINIPIPGRGSRVGPPAVRPVLFVTRHTPRGLAVSMRAEGDIGRGYIGGRRRPVTVAGTIILTHVGETPPDAMEAWSFRGNTGKMAFDVEFPASVPPGSRVWVSAIFFNARFENGRPSQPLCARIAGGEGLSRAA